MILNINLSEDKELRKAVLGMVQEAVRTQIRDIMHNTLQDEIMCKLKNSIEASIGRIREDFSQCNMYNRFYIAIKNDVKESIDMNALKQEIINEVANRIFNGVRHN